MVTTLYDEIMGLGLPVENISDDLTCVTYNGNVTAEQVAQVDALLQVYKAARVIEFEVPVLAPDFIVGSPKPKDDPIEALEQAIGEAGKDGYKSIALIALAVVKYVKHVEERLKKKGI